MSPYLQSTVDLYDPNAPWPNSSAPSGLEQPNQNRNVYPSPSASSFNLNESADPLALSSSVSLSRSTSTSLSGTTLSGTPLGSNLDFRGSLRAMADPNCITATEAGRRYLYVSSFLNFQS